MMHRSILALVALVAFAIGSSAAFADCAGHNIAGTTTKQSVASAEGMTPLPIPVPTPGDGS
jgi:hypothetical protein